MTNQIKMTNLAIQIQKMAKGLNRFSISDVFQIFPDVNEKEIYQILNFLEKELLIKKISETEYLYVKFKNISPEIADNILEEKTSEWLTIDEVCKMTGQKKETVRRKCKNKIYESKFIRNGKNKEYFVLKSCISKNKQRSPVVERFLQTLGEPQKYTKVSLEKFNRFKDMEEKRFFESLPPYAQRFIYKYLTVLRLAGNLRGKELREYLKKLGKNYPKYKMAFSSYMRYFRRYAIYGIKGLEPRAQKFEHKSCIPEDMYEEFKKIYLAPNKYSVEKTIRILEQMGYDKMSMPCSKTFKRQLYKEYSREEIEAIKKAPIILLEDNENDYSKAEGTRINEPIYEKYIDAAQTYFEKLENDYSNTAKSRKGIILNHLNPYFKNLNINQITQGHIQEFENAKLAEGYTPSSVKRITTTLTAIMRMNNTDYGHLMFTYKDLILPPTEQNCLSEEEIEKLKANLTAELWILALGIKVAELLALDYKDIDYENKSVNINKAYMNGTIQKYRKFYKKRQLKMPDILFKTLLPNGRGLIFKDVEIKNPSVLLNTHVKLMLDKKVPLNIISKLLGFQNLNEFDAVFGFLLPQELEDGFEIFK